MVDIIEELVDPWPDLFKGDGNVLEEISFRCPLRIGHLEDSVQAKFNVDLMLFFKPQLEGAV